MASFDKRPVTNVIVIGAGFSGLAMACQLQRKLNCDDYTIYDRSSAPGGAWWANKYPGCAVDIPAVFYSLSFAPNPNFSKIFPSQAEILNYFNDVAENFDVTRHIIPNTEWEGAYWQELTSTWLVKLRNLSNGQLYYQECKILISAVGGLVNPNKFDVPGMDDFQGDIIHTARWKTDVWLHGKDVIVVGNGCSAAQLVPAIADEAKSISQFIRTPQHYLQNDNLQINDKWRFILRHVPGVLLLFRILVFLFLESTAIRFKVTGSGLRARNQSAERSRAYIKKNAPEEYWPLLMPKYEIGCKRRVFDSCKYVSCLQRSNVHLTDDPITALRPRSILTKSGREYPADTIVLATGFSLTQYDVELIGRHGRSRAQHWDDFGYKEAYKSIAMSEFPNFFYVLGPNSGKGHTSTIYSIENYVDLIIQVIAPVIRDQSTFVEVKADSEKKYNEILHEVIGKTIFNNSCFSYFIDQKTQKNWFIYPWSSFDMWYDTHLGLSNEWIYDIRTQKKKPVLSSTILPMILALPIALFVLKVVLSGDNEFTKSFRRRF
ncbi:uncharacterized protein N7496_010079 [Penicillium cataractarum]|uniref:FAD/NAD(P)-binding domain-containing protein n=1 Tax=Penicillium cataractarum TaxID=2100454 RepID=A0A9W9RQ61_9EURO|nr:uncharacterized protein N7496_010079 [Penicillium cataractarum]KAJ5364366.1 hypothetical protein N7496_010079 [Penicillium cataractarum]